MVLILTTVLLIGKNLLNSAPSPRLHGEKNKKGNSFRHLLVQELTRDHKPNRDDERSRVEAAGGFVLTLNGVPRVNGQLAVSRAIGDLSFKR